MADNATPAPSATSTAPVAPVAQPAPKFMTTKEALRADRAGQLDPNGFGGKGTYDPSMDRGKWGGNSEGSADLGLGDDPDSVDLSDSDAPEGAPQEDSGFELEDGELPEGEEQADSEEPTDDSGLPPELAEFADGVHGVPLLELLEALRDGNIPEALMDKLHLEMSDGNKKWKEPLAKAKGERLMREKFTQLTQQLSQERKAFEAERADHAEQKEDLIDFMRTWKDPEALLDSLLDFGLPVDNMLRMYNGRLERVNAVYEKEKKGELPEGTAKALWEKYEQERLIKKGQYEQQLAEKKAQKKQAGEQSTALVNAVQKAGGAALTEMGADPTDTAQWNLFKRNLVDSLQRAGKEIPDKSDVWAAAKAAKEEYEEILASHERKRSAGAKQTVQQKAVAAGRGAPRGADPRAPKLDASTRKGAAPKPMTTKEFLKKNRAEFFKGR